MEPAITWYDVLGVLTGTDAGKIKCEYDAKAALLRPELISGAPPNVVKAVSRAQEILDTAWQVLGDPVSRERYDEAARIRGSGGGLGQPGTGPADPGLGRPSWASSAGSVSGDSRLRSSSACAWGRGILDLDWLGLAPHPDGSWPTLSRGGVARCRGDTAAPARPGVGWAGSAHPEPGPGQSAARP